MACYGVSGRQGLRCCRGPDARSAVVVAFDVCAITGGHSFTVFGLT